jgi:hypothetical protein
MIAVSGKDKIMTERQPTAAAQRALDEAEERRKAKADVELPKEVNGRPGPEPTRFGDWENKGITSDF